MKEPAAGGNSLGWHACCGAAGASGLGMNGADAACIHLPTSINVYAMKRTNIVLDEKLVRQGLRSTGMKTRRALVDYALRELVRREKQVGLLALKGKIRWEGNLEAMRSERTS
jgi:Arc/MetJ family transcription regulator